MAPTSGRRWWTTRASRCSARPARPGWAAPSGRGSPAGSGASLLELGGNNAAIVSPSADLDLTTRGIVFSAAGTAGQRCTTMRRVIAHSSVVDELTERLVVGVRPAADRQPDGRGHPGRAADPPRRLRGHGGAPSPRPGPRAASSSPAAAAPSRTRRRTPTTRRPAIVRIDEQTPVVEQETFAPLLYVLPYEDFDEAIALNNAVPQGLSSSVFTTDQAEAERFVSAEGSDCRHRQRQHRHLRRRDRRRVRRREGDRRRPRVRLGRLARLHAPGHQHRQLLRRAARWPRASTSRSDEDERRRVHDVVLAEQHGLGRRPERDEAVGAGDAGQPAVVPAVDQGRDDALGDAAAATCLVDDEDRVEAGRDAGSAPRRAAARASAGRAPCWPRRRRSAWPPPGGSGRRRCRT